MRSSSAIVVCLILAAVAGTGVVDAAVPEGERVRITAPAELEAMGFAPDAADVARWAYAAAGTDAPEAYGTTTDMTAIMPYAFQGLKAGFDPNFAGGYELYCSATGTYTYAVAQLELPDGAALSGMRFWVYDNDGSDDSFGWLFEICQPDAAAGNPSTTALIDEQLSNGTPTNYSEFVPIDPPVTVDNGSCFYLVEVRLGSSASVCQGSVLRLQKVRASWHRQISPQPATATFSDVPLGHWASQHVEALAASGITTGCGGGNFCPDSQVTRAQMAVFLAKAVGLFWNLDNH